MAVNDSQFCGSSTRAAATKKFDEYALLAKNLIVKDGGSRRVRDTVWGRKPQAMITDEGVAKGLRTIHRERGINTVNMRADDMRVVLSNHADFANEKTTVEHYLCGRGAVGLLFAQVPL